MCQHCPAPDPVLLGRRDVLRHVVLGSLAVSAARPRMQLPTSTAALARVTPPAVVTRAQWGADETIRNPIPTGWAPIRKVIVHHTASPNSWSGVQFLQSAYQLFVEGRGYSDIGYNFLIGRDGTIYEGRRARRYSPGELHSGEDASGRGIIGGHTQNFNAGSVGIALIGDYTSSAPTASAMTSLVHLIAWEVQRHQVDPLGADRYTGINGVTSTFANIAGHGTVGHTACPGRGVASQLDWVRHRVAASTGRFPARSADMRRLATIYQL